jgi:hypothetical protein
MGKRLNLLRQKLLQAHEDHAKFEENKMEIDELGQEPCLHDLGHSFALQPYSREKPAGLIDYSTAKTNG